MKGQNTNAPSELRDLFGKVDTDDLVPLRVGALDVLLPGHMFPATLLATLSLALSSGAASAVAAAELSGCAYVGERNVTLYRDASYVHLWNYVASRVADSLTDDVDTDKILDDKIFDMRTGLASLASRHQPRLNNAWYALTTLIVVVLILLPILVVSRVSVSRVQCGFLRRLLALPARTDSITWYTASTAAFASFITLFYIFQICSSLGAENAVDIMQTKTWEIRKDMRFFLNSMNCRFDQFLDGDIKPTLETVKGTFGSGISSSFPEQLAREVRNVMSNTPLQAIYNTSFLDMIRGTIAAYANKEEVAASLNNLVDSANKTDHEIQELWAQLVSSFGSLKSEARRDAVEQVIKIQKIAEAVQDNVHKKITTAKDVLLTHEIAYPGFLGMRTDPFQAGRRRLRLVTFVTSVVVVVFVLSLMVTIVLGISMRSPETMPAEKNKFSNFAGLAILFTAYGALPASAVLLVIGRNIMNMSVAAQAFICNPYSRRNPSLVDHIRFAAEVNRKYTAHILDYLTYPSSFTKCASALDKAIKTDIEPLEIIDIGRVRRKLLSGPSATAFRHKDADLSTLQQYVTDFKSYVEEERQRISIVPETSITKFIDYITFSLATGGDALAAKMSQVIEKSYRNIVRKRVLRLEAAFSGVRTNVIAALGHCDELKQAYDSGVSLMCNVILSNANGFWVALVIISFLLTCASFTSMRLSRKCLKMNKRELAVSEDEPVGHTLKESGQSISPHIRPKVVTGREECGDFRGAKSPSDNDLDVTVIGSVQSNRFYGDTVEGDHAFRA